MSRSHVPEGARFRILRAIFSCVIDSGMSCIQNTSLAFVSYINVRSMLGGYLHRTPELQSRLG